MSRNSAPFDPADAQCWIAHGRRPHHAEALAAVWTDYPDLPFEAPLDERIARSRARVAALRPLNDAIGTETERERQRANFACAERQVRKDSENPRMKAILQARDCHGYDWDAAVCYADGLHAAKSGWEARPCADVRDKGEGVSLRQAYMHGFRDGGGCREDIFDTARRAYAAEAMERTARRSVPVPVSSRPLPGTWPHPSDAPRPARWSRRVLIFGATAAADAGLGLFDMLQAQPGHEAATIIIAATGRGFRLWNDAGRIGAQDPADQLRALLADIDADDILVVADGDDLAWIDRHAAILPLCRTMERTRNSPIQQRAQFRVWLDRGFDTGEVIASGHIRWAKAAKGLSGRLGEFVTRYGGPTHPRGHRILVERTDGGPATGFMTLHGEPLTPETIISNKAHLRRHMTALLRRFAAAIPQP